MNSLTGSWNLGIDKEKANFDVLNGGVYSIAVFKDSGGHITVKKQEMLAPYSLNVFLQVIVGWCHISMTIIA